jgi:hypothetical protein
MSNNKKAYIIAGVGVVVVVLVVGTLTQVEPPSPTGPLCQALASLMLASVIGLIVEAEEDHCTPSVHGYPVPGSLATCANLWTRAGDLG